MNAVPCSKRPSRRTQWIIAGAAATALMAGMGVAQELALHAQSITRPESVQVFPGDSAGAKATNGYCLMCHSADMVLNQPLLKEDAWLGEVNKMREAFMAPIPEDQVPIIARYLYSIHGSEKGAGTGAGS
jgi:cytochrome c5